VKILKTYKQLFEKINTLRERLQEKLNLANNDCYEDNHNTSTAIQDLKKILGFDFDYEIGCTFNSIELSNVDYDNILDLLDIDERQLMLLLYPNSYIFSNIEGSLSSYIILNKLQKNKNLIKNINKIFNIDSNKAISFNSLINKMYEEIEFEIAGIYETNAAYFIKNIQDELIFEVTTDTIIIYPNLIESDLSTVEYAFYENINNLDLYLIGEPELTSDEEQELNNIIKEKLTEIFNYCSKNKQKIIEDVCKLNSSEIPDLYKIKNFGGDFLNVIKSFNYQKNKILDNNKINKNKYKLFIDEEILNSEIIRLKNMKEKSKKFNL
jgi:hypothetical protein